MFSPLQGRCFPLRQRPSHFSCLAASQLSDRRLSPRVVATLAVAVGLLHGWLNGVSLAEVQREGLGLAGIAARRS